MVEQSMISAPFATDGTTSVQTDIRNAGGKWVDQEVVVDQGLVTSRKPADIPAFNTKMIEEFGEGIHASRKVA